MNTIVVLAGLMLVVPRTDPANPNGPPTALTVLVLQTKGSPDQLGHPVARHDTVVWNFAPDTIPAPLSGSWSIRNSEGGGIELGDRSRLLHLGDLYRELGQGLPAIRGCCLDGDVLADCVLGQRHLVVARLDFEGGWRVRAIESDGLRRPRADVADDSMWGFKYEKPDGSLGAVTRNARKLSSALALEPLGGGRVTFTHDGSSALQNLAAVNDCKQWVGVSGQCAVVQFLNTVSPQGTTTHHPSLDHHHNLLYDLFTMSPQPRYLVSLVKDGTPAVMKDLLYTFFGSPAPRPCIPPVLLDPVELQP